MVAAARLEACLVTDIKPTDSGITCGAAVAPPTHQLMLFWTKIPGSYLRCFGPKFRVLIYVVLDQNS